MVVEKGFTFFFENFEKYEDNRMVGCFGILELKYAWLCFLILILSLEAIDKIYWFHFMLKMPWGDDR